MPLENDDVLEETRDYTKAIWIGVFVVITLMVGLIAIQGPGVPPTSVVTTKHILIRYSQTDPSDRTRALERIQEIRQRIVDGERFDDMARQYSEDPGTADKGGYISPQPRGTFADGYEEYVWEAPLDTLSPIVHTLLGFHLIVVTDRYISELEKYERRLDEKILEERSEANQATSEAAPAE